MIGEVLNYLLALIYIHAFMGWHCRVPCIKVTVSSFLHVDVYYSIT